MAWRRWGVGALASTTVLARDWAAAVSPKPAERMVDSKRIWVLSGGAGSMSGGSRGAGREMWTAFWWECRLGRSRPASTSCSSWRFRVTIRRAFIGFDLLGPSGSKLRSSVSYRELVGRAWGGD